MADLDQYQELLSKYNNLESDLIAKTRECAQAKEKLLQAEETVKNKEKDYIKLEHQYKLLESKYNLLTKQQNVFPKKERIITDEEILQIKKLRNQGLSYSKIRAATGWSNMTISRALNGAYSV